MRLPVRGRGAGRVDDRALRGRNRHHHARRRPAAARDLDRRLARRGDHGAMSAQRLARKAQAAASLVRDIERGLGQPIGRDARLAPQPVPGEALQKAPYRRGPHPLASAHHRAQAAEVDPRDLAIVDLAGPQAIVVAEVGRRRVRGADFRDQAQPGGRRMQKVRRRHAVTGTARYERKQGVADQPHVMVRRQPRHADGRALDRGAGIRDDVAVRHHHAPRAARGARGVLQEQHGLRRGAHSATQHARSPGRPVRRSRCAVLHGKARRLRAGRQQITQAMQLHAFRQDRHGRAICGDRPQPAHGCIVRACREGDGHRNQPGPRAAQQRDDGAQPRPVGQQHAVAMPEAAVFQQLSSQAIDCRKHRPIGVPRNGRPRDIAELEQDVFRLQSRPVFQAIEH